MQNIRRIGQTLYARFIIPKDRWADCGKREVVRTLQTTDRAEARRRRAKALEAIRQQLDDGLVSRDLSPLDADWAPSWQAKALRGCQELR